MKIIVKRRTDGPSIPVLGTPTSLVFNSVTVPLVTPSTGPAAIASYTIERSVGAGSTSFAVAATGPTIFGNPPTQYVDGGRIADTTYNYRARATDVNGRVSAYSSTVSVTTPAQPAGSTVNWNPGHYVRDSTVLYTSNSAPSASIVSAVMSNPGTTGLMIPVSWSVLEPTKGNYSWSRLDALIDQAAANDKHVLIEIFTRVFSSSGAGVPWGMPAWLDAEGHVMRVNSGTCAALHRTVVRDYARNLFRAAAARYANSSTVEMIITSETANPFDANTAVYPPPSDWSLNTYHDNLVSLAANVVQVAPKLNAVCMLNFAPDNRVETLGSALLAARCGIGGPDIVPQVTDLNGNTNGSIQRWVRLAQGFRWNGSAWVTGGAVYGGQVPILGQVQAPEMGGKEGCWSMQQFYDSGVPSKVTHYCWTAKTFEWQNYSGKELMWDSLAANSADRVTPTIRQWITDNGATQLPYTTYPTSYP